ncbi:MAG TPA: hydroxyisourate hydrolase [Buttiauxella sp.]|jgi:5-hydroxyisourate hydrolase
MKILIAPVLCLVSLYATAAPEGTLSVHVLNQQTGLPSKGVMVELEKQAGTNWKPVASGKTNEDGRIKSLFPATEDMLPGIYKVTFLTGDYFKADNQKTFFPSVPVVFSVSEKNQKLHIPLLLSQYGYSTYRGS